MNKHCKNCDTPNLEQAQFCAKCGNSLSISESSHEKVKKRTTANNMLNKKYIIIGAVVVAAIVGIALFSRDNSSTPDASVLEQGVKNLTREKAAVKIEEYLRINPGGSYSKTATARYNETEGGYRTGGVFGLTVDKLQQLEKEGFVKMIKPYSWQYAIYDFTDKAKPYLMPEEKDDTGTMYVILGKPISVEVTGLTEPSVSNGVNTRIANYTVKYEPTPIGKIVDEKQAGEEAKGKMPFTLYDDGWRIAQ